MLNSKRNLALACALSALAGYVDGIGFIYLGGLFVSFMSGNSTRLGISIADGQWMKALEAIELIVLFVAGAGFGSLIVRSRSRFRQALVLLAEASLLAVAAASNQLGWPVIPIAMIVVAMGVENAVFQTEGGMGIGLTYITGALVKAGQGIAVALTGGERWTWTPSLLLWASLVAGSVCGALTYQRLQLAAIWFAAAVALILSAVVAWVRRAAH